MKKSSLKPLLFVAYLFALGLSHFWRPFAPQEEPGQGSANAGQPAVSAERIVFVFPDLLKGRAESELLAQRLSGDANQSVLVASWPETAFDYEENEARLNSVLAESSAGEVVFLGIGYGAVEATLFAERQSGRVDSLVLLEPRVNSRFELLGDERLNTALKAFVYAVAWGVENLTPHFGLSQRTPWNFTTARQVFELDQSRASDAFEALQVPLVILTGSDDSERRKDVAKVYSSVAARGELVVYPGKGYALLDASPETWRDIFAASQLIEKTGGSTFLSQPSLRLDSFGSAVLLGVATFASEDLACIGAGILAQSGSVSLWVAILSCLLGIFFGDLGIFVIGRVFGGAAVDLPVLKWLVSAKAMDKGADWFERRGLWLIVLTRFLPGSRVPTYFAAGVVKVGWIRFAFALLVASAIWTPILVGAAFFLGGQFLDFFESLGASAWLALAFALILFSILMRILIRVSTWKGRRLLLSSWRRATRFEFWPMWAVYTPVVVYIVWLALRFRSVSLPFSVNPCMPASGLVYESKIQILEHLKKSGVPVARFEPIPLGLSSSEKIERLRAFMSEYGLGYPVVLKPDVGQRGQGVVIAKSEEQARLFFGNQEEDTIAQEYITGVEFGVFYQRGVTKRSGRITSITDKRPTYVIGDGERTLEQLILGDERAVCMARYFLNEYKGELERVLQKGERFALASIGTHSRGALFLDGNENLTAALAEEVDRFSREIPGFHFGRYDIRVSSRDAFRNGVALKVIELNGMTSEPTHMYDPRHGAIHGWRCLMRQWREMFELAKENRLAGHEPVSKKYVVKLAWNYFRGNPSRDLS